MTQRRPLLIIDGDSFAHRSYHALPKTIRRRGDKGAGAILGFANFLLRLYETEKPRAVLVGWDSLDEPHTGMRRWKVISPDARLIMNSWTNSMSCPSLWPPVVLQTQRKAATRPMTF